MQRIGAKSALFLSILMISSFGSLFIQAPEVKAQTDPWLEWASIAWRYYQPGVGVDVNTGLHYGTLDWHYVTDWDTGNYIVAILDAQTLDLISPGEVGSGWCVPTQPSTWGATCRLDKVLHYLETRELRAEDGLPYWAYNSTTGMPATNLGRLVTDRADTGRLLVALHVLKERRPDFAGRVDGVLARMRTAYSTFVSNGVVSYGFYGYYFALGFNASGFDVHNSLNEMNRLSSGAHVDVYGQQLPLTNILTEPFLNGILEVPDLVGPTFVDYARRVLEAQRGRWQTEASHPVTGWSEGPSDGTSGDTAYYLYEWIVRANGETWKMDDLTGGPSQSDIETGKVPLVYTKVAFGLHAIFGTDYTLTLVNAVLGAKLPTGESIEGPHGFREAIREIGDHSIIGNSNWPIQDKTNSIILSAARYALTTLSIGPVSPPSPLNGAVVTSAVTLQAQVTNGGPVEGASVTIYVDGGQVCSGSSDSNGYHSCAYMPTQAGHTYGWYATASKSGHNDGTSSTWAFTYQLPIPISQVVSDIAQAESDTAWIFFPMYGQESCLIPPTMPSKTDVLSLGYLLGSLSNPQNVVHSMDTQSLSGCGNPSGVPSGATVIAVAGLYPNMVTNYYELQTMQTPLYYNPSGDQGCIAERDAGAIIPGACTTSGGDVDAATSDIFAIQAFTDSAGHHVYLFWGVGWKGTLASTEYLVDYVLKDPNSFTKSWYVYRWNDATSGPSKNTIPDAGDTFTPIASG